jgi:hypothetical protein
MEIHLMNSSKYLKPRSPRGSRLIPAAERLEPRSLLSLADPSGYPALPSLKAITPQISLSRTTGQAPFVIQVDSAATRAGGSTNPYDELDYSWDFGDAATQAVAQPVTGVTVDADTGQVGPEAAYVYANPGTYTITLTVRGWDGAQYTTVTAMATVTVTAPSGWNMYFDPVAGNDANPGTVDLPKQSWTAVVNFLTDNGNTAGASNRYAWLKAGTTFSATAPLRLRYNDSGLRLAAYGSGPAPVIQAAASMPEIVSFETDYGRSQCDVVVSGIAFDGNGLARDIVLAYEATNNAASGLPYGSARNNYWLDDTFRGATTTQIDIVMNDLSHGQAAGQWGFWRSSVDSGNNPGNGMLFDVPVQGFVVGGSFTGGNGSITYDHHIYLNVWAHALVRWVNFGQATSRNFALKVKGRSDHVDVPFVVIDGCNVTGTQNGIEFGNENNRPDLGRFNEVIVENCAIHDTGSIGTQSMGIIADTVRRIAMRGNSFYNIGLLGGTAAYSQATADYHQTDTGTWAGFYANRFWKGAAADSSFLQAGALAGGAIADNVFETLTAGANERQRILQVNLAQLAGWTIDENSYYAPNMPASIPPNTFCDRFQQVYMNLASWQARGFDLAGVYCNPAWRDPQHGDFSTSPTAASTLSLSGLSGNLVAGTAGTLTVTVRNSVGQVVTGYTGTVHFTSSDAQAGLPADYTFTALDAGVHSFVVTLKSAGARSVWATDTTTTSLSGVVAKIAVAPAAATSLAIKGLVPMTAGGSATLTVTAFDPYGNVATGYAGTVHFSVDDAQATVPVDYTFVAGDHGAHTFSVVLKTAGYHHVRATDVTVGFASSAGVQVRAGAASRLILTGPLTVNVGAPVTMSLTVYDACGNIATGYVGMVHFTSTDAIAVLPPDYSFSATDAGVRTFVVTLLTSGTQAVTVVDSAQGGLTNTLAGIVVQ